MKKVLFFIIVGVMVLASSASAQPKTYIVVLNDNVSNPEEIIREHGVSANYIYKNALRGFSANLSESALAKIKNNPRVAFVSEDREVSIQKRPTRTPTPTQSPVQTIPTGINRVNAENLTNKGNGVHVAVIDTGIDLDHPDLIGNIAGGKNCNGTGTSYDDGNGHGTHVAGTIAASNNTIGVVGVAPEARLWGVRVLNNSGSGTWSQIICGLDFVTANAPANGGPITVANLSLGGSGESDNNCGNTNADALHKAICRTRDAGVTIVVAAGNSAVNASTQVPSAYDDAVITVSALADYDGLSGNDSFASFSNYGLVVDLGAPGTSIISTWMGGGYNTISGTSMASPHVAGAVALFIATHPGASWTSIRDALKQKAEALGLGHSDPSGLHPEPVVRADTL